MKFERASLQRYATLRWIVAAVFVALALRLCYIQLIDTKYKDLATSNIIRRVVEYPSRGEVLDRRGEYLVQSRECYDVMVIAGEIPHEGFDTMRMAAILDITPERLRSQIDKARRYPRAPFLVTNYVPQQAKLAFDECYFKGFYTVFRTARQYPRKIGGNLLGYVGEVSERDIKRWPYYSAGDYIGIGGVESAYEIELRGRKGVKVETTDTHGAVKGSYMDGAFDTLPVNGRRLISTIDARLQAFAEELMEGKIGAVVAIEPSSGEILVMASSPTYDPDELVGRQRGNHYMTLQENVRQPLFNRAVKSKYPPGSTFKLVQGLIGMQEGVLHSSDLHPCHEGFVVGKRKVKCHSHRSPVDLRDAVATSCNAYFCYVFKDIITNPKYGGVRRGLEVWREYVESFGFGRTLDSDFIGEGVGNVPSTEDYDRMYNGRWNWGTPISLSIGQGEMGCTPLQMANLAAIVANRGYYYIPHIVKHIEGCDSLDARFYQRQYTKVDSRYFEPIVEGMWRGVNVWGTSRGAELPGLDVCGKTGTAQNPHGKDHSTFLSFAPKDNPRIAISVYVENGGFGATIALPIASLIEELYLTDTIRRPEMLRYVKEHTVYYPYYDKLNAKKNRK